jgi:phosphoglycerate kinase
MPVKKMADLDLNGKRILIRQDLNVPVKDGGVQTNVLQRVVMMLLGQIHLQPGGLDAT